MGSHVWEKNHQTKRMSAQKYLDNLERYICLNLKPGSFNILLSANLKVMKHEHVNLENILKMLTELNKLKNTLTSSF